MVESTNVVRTGSPILTAFFVMGIEFQWNPSLESVTFNGLFTIELTMASLVLLLPAEPQKSDSFDDRVSLWDHGVLRSSCAQGSADLSNLT